MTKTCPDCHATVLSTSQPDRMGFIGAMDIVERGFKAWKDKPHNAKWFKRIDGTPIPNDLAVNIAEAVLAALAATPAVGGEAMPADPNYKWGVDYGKDLLKDINQLAHAAGTGALHRDMLQRAYREIRRLAAQPASPLRGRDSIIEECAKVADNAREVAKVHYGVEASIGADIAARRIRDLSASSPEQPAATPDIVKMYSDMERAKNARIGELEEAFGKAVLSAPPVRQLTENERDAIAIAEHQCECSSPSDPEVRFDYELVRTLLSLIASPPEQPAGPVTTEQLDELQFGRALHNRPEQPAAYPVAAADKEHADLLRRLAAVSKEEK